jgi:hypothetical protein
VEGQFREIEGYALAMVHWRIEYSCQAAPREPDNSFFSPVHPPLSSSHVLFHSRRLPPPSFLTANRHFSRLSQSLKHHNIRYLALNTCYPPSTHTTNTSHSPLLLCAKMEPYYDDHQVRSHYAPSIEDSRATLKKPIESDVANSFHVIEPWDENRYACGWFSPCINVKSGRVPYVSSDHDISDNVWSSNSRSQSSHASATWYFDDEYLASWPTSAALFVGACVAAVPMAQYRPEHQYNNGGPFSHDARSYSHAPCKVSRHAFCYVF